MNYKSIKYFCTANGKGVRTALFVSGCRLHCEGCFNKESCTSSGFSTVTLNRVAQQSTSTRLLLSCPMYISAPICFNFSIISEFLMSLGVDEETATEDACRIEHVISPESFEAMKRFLEEK